MIQIGGVYATFCQREGILFKNIGVRGVTVEVFLLTVRLFYSRWGNRK